ncbi:MAG: SusC/RagA family TonB-linked outer membrane protein [Mangrovibacterium sp.]
MKKKSIVCTSHIRKKVNVILLKMKMLIIVFLGSIMSVAAGTSSKIKGVLHVQSSSLTENSKTTEEKYCLTNVQNYDFSYALKGKTNEENEHPEEVTARPETAIEKTVQPEKLNVSGTVVDIKGEPIPGATVLIKSTTIGTTTDFNGKFSLQIPPESQILQVSFVGFITQEIPINNKTNFHVILKDATVGVEEVVIVGYGTQKKESIVGAITQATNEQLKRSGNVTDLKQALTGQLPGVTTITASGEPGGTSSGQSSTSVFIRGQNTWNGGQPLILVDGAERSMDNLDVSEVESISVLKDASATAVFGVKGANGVILITTKRGRQAKPKLSFSYNTTALMVSKLPQKLDSYEAIMLRNEMIEREVALNQTSWDDYIPYEIAVRYHLPQTPEYALLYPNVNWEKALFKQVAWTHRANLNVQGGTNFVKYFGALSYLYEGDMFKDYNNHKGYDPNYDFNRFNFRSNLDFKLTKTTNLKINLAGIYSQKNTNYAYNNSTSGTNPLAWAAVYRFPPDVMLPQYADGSWGQNYSLPPEQLQNPVALIYNTGIWERRTTALNADFALEQKLDFITEGLSFTATLFYDNSIQTVGGISDGNNVRPESNLWGKIIYPDLYTGLDQDPSEYTSYTPVTSASAFDWVVSPWTIDQESVSSTYTNYLPISRRLMYQGQLNYIRRFKSHNIGAMGLFKREEYALGSMFPTYREDWVFRTTYDYNSKYLFEFNGAYNGSEKFGPGYRFDFFPSLALGWYISNEKFFKIDWINRLKVRFSAGLVGDDAGTGARWLYQSQYSYGGQAHMSANPNQSSPYTWYKESVVGNPDIHWEKARKDNFGLEAGLFDNLISVNYDYFTEDRTDIMLAGSSRAIPSYFGATPPAANLGEVKSKGHEFELKFNKLTSYKFNYWASLAVTHTQNEIVNRNDPALQADYLKQAGYAIGQTRTQVSTGFYNNWDEVFASVPQETNDLLKLPGYYNILDFNGDGVITSNDDTVPYGYSEIPENTCNLSLGAGYKGFSIMLQFYGVNNVSRYVPLDNFYQYQNTLFEHVRDYWSEDNQDASSFLPRWKTEGEFIGSYYIYDGSYIRLKTAELAYDFSEKQLKKLGLSDLRLFVNGNNLFFWSDLPDDRESAWSGGAAAQGAYPTPKRINFGFELTF